MSDAIINLNGIEDVIVAGSSAAVTERRDVLTHALAIRSVECDADEQESLANIKSIEQLIKKAKQHADVAKLDLLRLVKEVDQGLGNYLEPLLIQADRLELLCVEYTSKKRGAK